MGMHRSTCCSLWESQEAGADCLSILDSLYSGRKIEHIKMMKNWQT